MECFSKLNNLNVSLNVTLFSNSILQYMRSFFTKLFFCFSLFFIPSLTQSQWQWQNPIPQGNILFGSHFINDNTGYACGDGGTIIKTTDGGNTWAINKTKTKESIRSLSFTDENSGWACGLAGTILKTTNGGVFWDRIISGTTGNLFCVRFLNSNTGIIVGDTGIVMKTTNGGNSFERKPTGISLSLTSCSLMGNIFLAAGLNGAYARSADYGNTWQQISTGNNNYFFDIMFKDSVTSFISGAYGTILRSTDAGLSWTRMSTLTGNWFYTISFGDAMTGFASSDYGNVYKTTNAGLNWTGLASTTSEAQYSLKAFDEDEIISFGNKGSIITTSNSGLNWSNITNGFRNTIYSLDFINDNTGYGCGGQGSFIKTTNGGTDWIRSQAGSTNDFLFNIDMTNEFTGYCAGYFGKFLKTTDGGANWSDINLNTERSINAVYFFNENTGWICGDSGMLLRSDDGFASSVSVPADQNFDITDIEFVNTNVGYYSSQQRKIFKTTDAGENWFTPHTGDFGSTVGGLDFIDANTGIAFTYNNKILITNDGGVNWIEKLIPPGNYLNNVYISGHNNYWAVGDFGFIYRSTDGGAFWYEENDNNFMDRIFGIYFKNNSEGWVSGGNGLIAEYYNPQSSIISLNQNNNTTGYKLNQNYPNPFNPATVIQYELPVSGNISLKVYDVLGNEVAYLVNERQNAGSHSVKFDGNNLSSGVYFYKLETDDFSDTRRMVLIK